MADDHSAFWLPSDFLNDDDFTHNPNPTPNPRAEPSRLLAELTRHLAHSMSLTPRSTHAAAWPCSGFPAAPYDGSPTLPPVSYNAASQSTQFLQASGGACRAASVAPAQSAWPVRPHEPQLSRMSHACAGGCYGGLASGGLKRQSTGTGVFLPRRVGNNPAPQPRKKQGFSTVLLPARVIQALNLNVQDNPCFLTNHDLLLARRNAILAQQRRLRRAEGQIGQHEVPLLPQEWTY